MAFPLIPVIAVFTLGMGAVTTYKIITVGEELTREIEQMVQAKSMMLQIDTPEVVFTDTPHTMEVGLKHIFINPENLNLDDRHGLGYSINHELCHIKLGHFTEEFSNMTTQETIRMEIEAEQCAIENSTHLETNRAQILYEEMKSAEWYKSITPRLSVSNRQKMINNAVLAHNFIEFKTD